MKIFAIIALVGVALFAQKVEPVAAPLPQQLSLEAKSPTWAQVKVGQTVEEVERILGKPFGEEAKGGRLAREWRLSPEDTLLVVFKNNRVRSIRHLDLRPKPETPGQEGRAIEKAAGIALGIYLAHFCPAAYRKPLLLMNASDAQLLQQCNANGFMLFGMYVYRGLAEPPKQ